jgi:hypothetical protein
VWLLVVLDMLKFQEFHLLAVVGKMLQQLLLSLVV